MTAPFENPTRKRALAEETARTFAESRLRSKWPGPGRTGGVREVALLAYPVVLAQLSVTLMGVVDSAMVGRLGAVELAAVGFAGSWMWTFFCFFLGAAGVVQTFVAQHHGAGQPEECGAWPWQAVWLAIPMTVLLGIALLTWLNPLLDLILPSEGMRPLAEQYMSIRVVGQVGMVSGYAFSSFFRGIGDTRTPLYVTILSNLLNVILDYGLIFGELGLPAWGVAGAAVATCVAEWTFAILMLAIFLRPNLRGVYHTKPVRISWTNQKRMIRTGAPIGGQWTTEMLFFSVFLTLVARLGDNQMAASHAFLSLLSLSFMQASGVGIAVATLVGRHVGSGQLKHVKTTFVSGQKLAFSLSLLTAAVFLLWPEALMQIFTDDPEVIALGRPLMMLGALYQLIDVVCIVSDNALRGAGDTTVPFLIRLALASIILIPLTWYLGFYLDGGLTGMWLASGLDLAILGLFLVWRFQSGAWKKIQI